MRLRRLLVSTVAFILAVSLLNWSLASALGIPLRCGAIDSLVDSFYFTTVVMTTLGFGDLTPTESLGRFIVGWEAISGFLLFAFLTSTLYRRLSS